MSWNRRVERGQPCPRVFLILAAAILLGVIGCGDADGDDDPNGNNGGANHNNSHLQEHPNLECSELDEQTLCNITGEITEDLTLADDGTIYQLSGPVFVGDDVDETVLTVEAGVTVFADPASAQLSMLVVRRNAKIIADGTRDAPIVFTPAADEGTRRRGMWGGLMLNGNAPLNTGTEADGEGNSGLYGGDDPDDDSGVLRYVRVEYAGYPITPENELNGISFQGVGRGTTLEYIQVHMNADDGVEFFGGTASARYLVRTGIADDSIDWTDGWQGNIQFALVEQYDDEADRGIEADNNSDNNDATPRSHAKVSNATFIGGAAGDTGVLLRRGTTANLHNIIVTGFDSCLDLDDQATFVAGWDAGADDNNGELSITNSIIDDCDTLFEEDDDGTPFSVQEWFEAGGGNEVADPMLDGWAPEADSPAMRDSVQPDGDTFFEKVGFVGAIGQDDWTAGWTTQARD
jgi:hypothetical protein